MAGFDFLLSNAPAVELPKPPPVAASSGSAAIAGSFSAAPRATLAVADRELLNALAAYQIRYGKPEEALAFLQLTNRLWPNDSQTLRLMTQAFLALEDYASAEMTEDAYRRLTQSARPNRADLLRQAMIHFGHLRLAEARRSLLDCLALHKSEAL